MACIRTLYPVVFGLLFSLVICHLLAAQVPAIDGDELLSKYFSRRVADLEQQRLDKITTAEEWTTRRAVFRQQLATMLGLEAMPGAGYQKPVITRRFQHEDIQVECLHFQSMPGLYVTANFYRPQEYEAPLPAILYVCGHGRVKKDGISYGNKTHYHHHGVWFARNGFACLVIDTVQLGEIEGLHHGTYRENMWWWNAIGYTPAGVEAFNGIRAIDYLCDRPEIDDDRIGVTGRSGGGAYSWWIAALDDRVKVAVPVAGITSLRNHIVDGCVEGHCDCMYPINTFRWDFPHVAALVSPRPLLISNTDQDRIFPLDGVVDVHRNVRRIYELQKAEQHLGLHITAGPHSDTQELRIHAFRWLQRYLRDDESLITRAANKVFEPEQLKVFDSLPKDEINTTVHEKFIRLPARPAVPASQQEWKQLRDRWMSELANKCFRSWPQVLEPRAIERFDAQADGTRLQIFEITGDASASRSFLYMLSARTEPIRRVRLSVVDESEWQTLQGQLLEGFPQHVSGNQTPARNTTGGFDLLREQLRRSPNTALGWYASRGIGPTAWAQDSKHHTQIRRRFNLLGETLDSMRVWDVRHAVRVLREQTGGAELDIAGNGTMGAIAAYACLFETPTASVQLTKPPASHRDGPIFLNVLRVLDMPAAIAMLADHSDVTLTTNRPSKWEFAAEVADLTGSSLVFRDAD